MQHFHWLAGSGGTYGFDDITSWGTYGEELCDYLLKLQTPVADADLDKLGTAFRTVEQLFAAYTPSNVARAQDDIVQNKMRNTQELLTPPSQGLANAILQAQRQITIHRRLHRITALQARGQITILRRLHQTTTLQALSITTAQEVRQTIMLQAQRPITARQHPRQIHQTQEAHLDQAYSKASSAPQA
jgi:hypothetical protein